MTFADLIEVVNHLMPEALFQLQNHITQRVL